MRPQVQYARAADGVRIAFARFGPARGDALPLVALRPPQWSHLEREWGMPRSHREFEDFIDARPVVRLDPRGCGLSSRGVADQSLEARLSDIAAVVDRAGLERFVLDAISSAGLPAIAYAARHPERVAGLVVQNGFVRGAEWWGAPARHSILAVAQIDWEAATESWAWLTFGSTDAQQVREVAEHTRACLDQRDFLALVSAEQQIDVEPLLAALRTPTLVLRHPRFSRLTPEEQARELGRLVPHARVVTVASTDERVDAIRRFLLEQEGPLAPSGPEEQHSALQELTARENEILARLVRGESNREIARGLIVSTRTVDGHVARIYRKLDVHNRAELVASVYQRRLLERR